MHFPGFWEIWIWNIQSIIYSFPILDSSHIRFAPEKAIAIIIHSCVPNRVDRWVNVLWSSLGSQATLLMLLSRYTGSILAFLWVDRVSKKLYVKVDMLIYNNIVTVCRQCLSVVIILSYKMDFNFYVCMDGFTKSSHNYAGFETLYFKLAFKIWPGQKKQYVGILIHFEIFQECHTTFLCLTLATLSFI